MKYIPVAVVFVDNRYGFNHINTRLSRTDKDALESIRGGDLPYSPYNDYYSNVCFNIQYNTDDDRGGYGYAPVIHDCYNLDINDAENVIKLLRKVDKGYNKLRSESNNYEALPSLVSFLKAAKVKRVFIRHLNTVGFDNLSVEDAIIELTKLDEKFTKGV